MVTTLERLSLTSVYEAARELTRGHSKPSIKLAFWAAALSPRNALENNGKQVEALREYVNKPLPFLAEQVQELVRGKGGFRCSRQQALALICIEEWDRAGLLKRFERMPRTPKEWLAWRRCAVALPGISWKCASFAALLLWPLECPLVPVDRHVLARFGKEAWANKLSSTTGKAAYLRYRSLERAVRREAQAAGVHEVAVWHWYKWSEWRQANGDEAESGRPESHRLLSPYVW